jgi:hypothetical protein
MRPRCAVSARDLPATVLADRRQRTERGIRRAGIRLIQVLPGDFASCNAPRRSHETGLVLIVVDRPGRLSRGDRGPDS